MNRHPVHLTFLLVLVSGVLIALALALSLKFHRGYSLPRFAIVVVAAPLAAGLLLDLLLVRRFPGIGRAFPLLLLLEVAALTLATFLRSPDLYQSLFGSFEKLLGLASYASAALLALGARAATWGSEARFRWLLRAIAAAGLATVLQGGVQQERDSWRWTGTFGHANYSSNLLLLPLFVAPGLALGARSGIERLFGAAVGLLVAIALALLKTRGAWLGAAVGLAVFGALLLWGPIRLERTLRRRLLLASALVCLAAGATLLVPGWRGKVLSRARETFRLEAGTSGRYESWKASIRFFHDHALLGVGAESFRNAFLPYKTEELGRVLQEQQLSDFHAQPLHLLAEGGVGALAAFIGLSGLALARLLRTVGDPSLERGSRWLAGGLLAGLAAHLVHCLTISHILSPSVFFHVALGAAASAGEGWTAGPPIAPRRKAAPPAARLASGAAVLALLAAAAVFSGRLLLADHAILWCKTHGSPRGILDLDKAIEQGRRAVELAPRVGSYHGLYARTLKEMVNKGHVPAPRRDEVLRLALVHALRAVERGETPENNHLELGHIHYLARRFDLAEREFRAAIAADPHFWSSYHQLALLLFQEGKEEEARKQAEAARRLAPQRQEVEWLLKRLGESPRR